jgi:hypothetical protein
MPKNFFWLVLGQRRSRFRCAHKNFVYSQRMRRTNRSIQRPSRMYTDKSTITTLSFRDEMMSRGTKGEMKAQNRPRFERKQVATRHVEDTARGCENNRSCADQFNPVRADPQREIVFSPMSPAKTSCSSDIKSPTCTINGWNGGDFKSIQPRDHRTDGVRSPLRRTHSAPPDTIPNLPPRRQRPSRRFSRPMIEVLPGQSMPLIGFLETKHYFRQGNCIRVACMECTMSLYCAMDSSYMLCAICESISPLRHGEHEHPLLGFGVTMDQISE